MNAFVDVPKEEGYSIVMDPRSSKLLHLSYNGHRIGYLELNCIDSLCPEVISFDLYKDYKQDEHYLETIKLLVDSMPEVLLLQIIKPEKIWNNLVDKLKESQRISHADQDRSGDLFIYKY